jgi:tRNA(Ile)-lysidine synthetase, N-terminal domain/tRNA(Ile)-lysidine synthetase, C-terminal domain
MELPDRLVAALAALDLLDGTVVTAVSGGPDSVALLDLLIRSRPSHRLQIIVAHADHGIHPESGAVAATVRALAASCACVCEVGELRLGAGTSETAAREARYRWLRQVAARHRVAAILTAHHAEDQAETVLMRLLAGSGPAGLAGMAPRTGLIVRPLLSFRREALAQYVHERGLPSWDDPANSDPAHLRSWLRAAVLPLIAARVPAVGGNWGRTARLARADRAAWDAVLTSIQELDCRAEPGGISVAAAPLAGYDSALAGGLLRALGRRVGCLVGDRRAERLLGLAREGKSGRWVPLGTRFRAELTFGRLRLHRVGEPPPGMLLASPAGEASWGEWSVRWSRGVAPPTQGRADMTAWFSADALSLRTPVPGDRIRPIGGPGTRPLVRCFQEAKVPRDRRGGWPVLESNGSAVWVPGICRADALVPEPGAEALRVDVTNR